MQENHNEDVKKLLKSFQGKLSRWYKTFTIEMMLLLIFGMIVGVAIKVEASKYITRGYDDAAITAKKQSIDFAKIAEDLAQEQEGQEASNQPAPTGGAACGI